MVRAVAAEMPLRARFAGGLVDPASRPVFEHYLKLEPWVHRAVPAMIVLFIATLTTLTIFLVSDAHQRAIEDAIINLELIAANATHDFNAALEPNADASPLTAAKDVLTQVLPDRALARGQTVLVTNVKGDVVAAFPASASVGGRLLDRLGPSQPLTIFAEKAGVMRINLADGTDALATVRTLKPPFAQVAFIHPINAVLSDWQRTTLRTGIALSLDHHRALLGCRRLFLAGGARPACGSRQYTHSRPDRHGAQSRPLRPVGLGYRPRPHLLVRLHVCNARNGS